ncbi:osmotically inducible protein C [Salinibacter sp. 10B]|uniref:OsmC family protein n=1 Tax=Salinibacter sp. 10B TaxID=1923971 RepID=UPI000CF4E6E8|nr:OsmC family protein [Salinibacter sp. 10B]PQJ33415.1 osmotically inducible protein C [Salinibacter sp. 10B]
MATVKESKRLNGVDLEVLNETISALQNDPALGKSQFRARNKWVSGNHNRSTISEFYTAKEEMTHKQSFELHADEPPILAGNDEAPNPVEHLLNALASCVTTSIVAHAAVRGIEIEEMEAELEGDIDLNGFLGLDMGVPKGYTDIRMTYRVKTDATNAAKLRSLADFSPVYHTITNGAKVDIDIQPM